MLTEESSVVAIASRDVAAGSSSLPRRALKRSPPTPATKEVTAEDSVLPIASPAREAVWLV